MTDKLMAYLSEGEAFLVISPENRLYLTGFESTDGYLLVTAKESVFLTDSRYIEAARAKVTGCTEIALLKNAAEDLNGYIKSFNINKVYIEASRLSVGQFNSLGASLDCECLAEKADEAIKELRRTKTESELKNICAAQRIAEQAFEHIRTFIKPGVTDREIGLELDYFMLRAGAQALSFETIAVSGRNSSMPHGVPTDKKVERGDFVTMDYGAVVNDYHSDMTRTVFYGAPTDEQKRVFDLVCKANAAGIAAVRPGVPLRAIDGAARKVISDAGYGDYFGHSFGHSLGLYIHESPAASPSVKTPMPEGAVISAEPGIYLPGKFGVRIEDVLILREGGCEVITKAAKQLLIL